MSENNHKYDVRVDWTTAAALGDTLAIGTDDGLDDQWVEAFTVVLEEHERRTAERKWSGIDFEHASDEEETDFVLYVRNVEPEARSFELRRIIDDLVKATNTVAQVGTHVYDLARELREPQTATPRASVPPPAFDPLADELRADA